MRRKKGAEPFAGIFWWAIIVVVVIYLFLKFGFPYVAAAAVGKSQPLPAPSTAILMFMIVALIGAAAHIFSNDLRMKAFLRPLFKLLKAEEGGTAQKVGRAVFLAAIPLLMGFTIWEKGSPSLAPPVESRLQHPTIPGKYEKLVSPIRNPSEETVQAFMEEGGYGSMEEARGALLAQYLKEGREIYQKNCTPCHGPKADGTGIMARGFHLKPANFTDPGTIATVIEPYAFWRVSEGGIGLPTEASPWNSAMPRWEDDLTEDEIWKVVYAMYDLAGAEPRLPEKLEHE